MNFQDRLEAMGKCVIIRSFLFLSARAISAKRTVFRCALVPSLCESYVTFSLNKMSINLDL